MRQKVAKKLRKVAKEICKQDQRFEAEMWPLMYKKMKKAHGKRV